MFKSYFKIALRKLLKQKIYTFINIFGLSLGIACCILIFLYVQHEWSYDAFHENKERIFRLIQVEKRASGEITRSALQPVPLAPAVQSELAGVKHTVRFIDSGNIIVKSGEKTFTERILYADPAVFKMFSFPLLHGDSETVLQDLASVVLTTTTAEKYFGDAKAAFGQHLSLKIGGEFKDFTVSGIAADTPSHSSIRFDFVLPFLNYPSYESTITRWNSSRTYTYIQLADNWLPDQLENQLSAFVDKYFGEGIRQDQKEGYLSKEAAAFRLRLQPLTDIHLTPDIRWGMQPASNPAYSYILSCIAMLVLLLACINFTTLTVGRSGSRAAEIGLRKVVGAVKTQLVRQFFGEALMMSFVALLLGIGLAELFLPTFNDLAQKELVIRYIDNATILLALPGLMLLVGLAAGAYPALYLAKFQPVSVLKGQAKPGGKNRLMRSLVVVQYTLSIFLIISTLVMANQLDFMKNRHLGYKQGQVVAIRTFTGWNNDGARLVEITRNRLLGHQEIVNVTGTIFSFTRGWSEEGWRHEGEEKTAYVYRVDDKFIETLGMELVAGRNFSKDFPSDPASAVIINQALAREYGWQNPLGQQLKGFRNVEGLEEPTVIGVVKDFNFQSLHQKVAPALLHISPNWPIRYILVRIDQQNVAHTLALLKKTWQEISPDTPFQYYFLDEDVQRQYLAEMRWSHIVGFSSILAILIAGLGLIGLATLSVSQRLKEIGIRKVLGASMVRLARLVGQDFVKLVTIGYALALPVAWYVMNRWLQDFAYRTTIGLETYLLAGLIAISIAVLTVSYQAVRAALANPVETLRCE